MGNENVIALRLALSGVSQVTNGLKTVGAAMVAALAGNLTAGNLIRMTEAAIDAADAMGKLAQKSGIAVEALSGLSFAARMGDLSSEEFANALKFLNKTMAETGRGTEDTDARLMELADQFAAMEDGPQKAKLALDNFGKAGVQLIPFLNQGSEAIRKQREEAKAFGLVINQEFADNADRFNDNMFRIKSSVQGLFLAVAEQLLPTIIQLQERFIDFTKDVATREAVITGLVEIFKRAALFAAGLAQAFEQVSIWSQFMTPLSEVMRQSDEAFTRLGRLAETLDQIGEASDRMAESASKPKADFLDAEKLAKYQSVLQDIQENFLTLRNAEGEALHALQKQADDYIAKIADNAATEVDYWIAVGDVFEGYEMRKTQIQKKFADERIEIEKQEKQKKQQLQQDFLRTSGDIFGSMAQIAKLYGEKGFKAWKAFAVAQAVINGAGAVLLQMSSGDPYSMPFRAAAAGIAAAAQIATIIATQPTGYMAGGYTGNGPASQVAGEVHRREFVFSAPAVENVGLANLSALHDAARGGGSPSVSVGGANITNAVLFTESDVRRLFKSRSFKEETINLIRLSKFELGLT